MRDECAAGERVCSGDNSAEGGRALGIRLAGTVWLPCDRGISRSTHFAGGCVNVDGKQYLPDRANRQLSTISIVVLFCVNRRIIR